MPFSKLGLEKIDGVKVYDSNDSGIIAENLW